MSVASYGRRSKRRSEKSWSSQQQSDSSWEDDSYPRKKRTAENNGLTFERVRGRPRGHNRAPLTKEEQRKRNAFYERDRREKLAEGWRELREAMETDAAQNKLLAEAVPYVKFMERKMQLFEKERNFQHTRNAVLQAKLNKLKDSAIPPMIVEEAYKESFKQRVVKEELIQEYDKLSSRKPVAKVVTLHTKYTTSTEEVDLLEPEDEPYYESEAYAKLNVKQEYADSGVHSIGISTRSSNPSFSSPDFSASPDQRVPSPESRLLALNPQMPTPENNAFSGVPAIEKTISFPEPKIALPNEKPKPTNDRIPYYLPKVASSKPRVYAPDSSIPTYVNIPHINPVKPSSKHQVSTPTQKITNPQTRLPSSPLRAHFCKPRISTLETVFASEPRPYFYNNQGLYSVPAIPSEAAIPFPDPKAGSLNPSKHLHNEIQTPSEDDIFDYVESVTGTDPEESQLQFLEDHYYYHEISKITPKPATVPESSIFSFKVEAKMIQYWGNDIQRQLMEFEKEFELT